MKIVMLVDNEVEGDSRVQKTARSAADAGHDVTLLGIGEPRSWRLGAAEVRVLPLPGSDAASNGLRATLLRTGGWPLQLARWVRKPWEYARSRYWQAKEGDRSWRRLEPGLWNYERAMAATIDELEPDLVYANDFRMLGVGARAKSRRPAERPLRLVWDAHEFLPGIKPRRDNAYWLPAHCSYEREYAHQADAVVTVSDPLADLLHREHGLKEKPTVVLNAPDMSPAALGDVPDLRALCGIGADTPLIVYSGSASAQRGLDTAVNALARLDGVHLALVVADPDAPNIQVLKDRSDRVHAVPYVPYWQVVPFLSKADAGVIPIHHWPNHELALITKFFEYAHARLPIVVSDVKTMAATVRATGQGEVFRAEDAADFATAVGKVLAAPQRYRRSYDSIPLHEWTWSAQAATLNALYDRLTEPAAEPAPESAQEPTR